MSNLNYGQWEDELNFILDVDLNNVGSVFNNDLACFESYCKMQASSAEREGYPTIAQVIRSHAASFDAYIYQLTR